MHAPSECSIGYNCEPATRATFRSPPRFSAWIKDPVEGETALGEMLRVLQPGGQLAIFAIFHASKYASTLRQLDAASTRAIRIGTG